MTVNSFRVVQDIMENDGYYPGDSKPVVAIHRYETHWGGSAFHLAYSEDEVNRLFASDSMARNPVLIWRKAK